LRGVPIPVVSAGAGVVGGAPPATVEIVYCCARAGIAAASRIKGLNMRVVNIIMTV
jgi:hypothetical protein